MQHCSCIQRTARAAIAAWLTLTAWCPPAFAQDSTNTNGVEVGFNSGHADRGFVISDRPVVQPEAWASAGGVEFSVWSSFTLAPNTDHSRPQIVELQLTREQQWGNLRVAPAITTFFYRDLLSVDRDHSVECWLDLSYDLGPFRLFTEQSVDVRTYPGAYFGEAGIKSEGYVSQRVELGGSVGAGWASATFNDSYAGVAKAGLDRVNVEGWMTVHVIPHYYIGPQVELSTIVNSRVRAALARPTFVLFGITTGVEF